MMQNAVYRYAECGLLPFHGRCMDVCPLKTSILPASAFLFFTPLGFSRMHPFPFFVHI